MTRIYVSDKGDDNNDALTRETAVYSWEWAAKLCDGNSQVDTKALRGNRETTEEESADRSRRAYSFADFVRSVPARKRAGAS
jgi:hypothetical protein